MTTWKGSSRPPEKACMTHYLLPILSATKKWGINRGVLPTSQPTKSHEHHAQSFHRVRAIPAKTIVPLCMHCSTDRNQIADWHWNSSISLQKCLLQPQDMDMALCSFQLKPLHSVVTHVQKNTPYRTMSLHSLLVVSNFCSSHRND